jgi:hypothetical protein
MPHSLVVSLRVRKALIPLELKEKLLESKAKRVWKLSKTLGEVQNEVAAFDRKEAYMRENSRFLTTHQQYSNGTRGV